MTLADPPEPTAPAATLADRRPAHAVMTHLLQQLDGRAPADGSALTEVPADLLAWHVGAEGEVIVGQELALLPEQWHVLHAVPAGSAGADIDHLVIGPGGVFVLNTKHHRGKAVRVGTRVVWLDGFQQSGYQSELLRRSAQVQRVLRRGGGPHVTARPLLVFVAAGRLEVSGPQEVAAVRAARLVPFLLAQPPVLDPGRVDALVRAARRPSTWGAPESVLSEPDPTMRFHALRRCAPVPRRLGARRPAPFPAAAARPAGPPRRTPAGRRSSAGRPLVGLALLVGTLAVLPVAASVTASVLSAVLQALLLR